MGFYSSSHTDKQDHLNLKAGAGYLDKSGSASIVDIIKNPDAAINRVKNILDKKIGAVGYDAKAMKDLGLSLESSLVSESDKIRILVRQNQIYRILAFGIMNMKRD